MTSINEICVAIVKKVVSLLLKRFPPSERTAFVKKVISFLLERFSPVERGIFLKNEAEQYIRLAYPPNPHNNDRFDYDWFKYESITQSTLFYADILPILANWLFRQPRRSSFRLLDVGGATGAGGEFLAKLFYKYFPGYNIIVDVLDIEETYERLSPLFNDHIASYKVGDVFDVPDGGYDICICSHTIEHIKQELVLDFMEKVIDVSSKLTIFNAPYMESDNLPDHSYTIDDQFLATLPKPTSLKTYRSLGWYRENQPSLCVMLTYEK